jgi:hypothetical protein
LVLVVVALLLTDWLLWEPGLTEDNVRRIRPGMTLAEVEALLGGPAADTFEMPPTTGRFAGSGSGGRAAIPSWCSSSRTGA